MGFIPTLKNIMSKNVAARQTSRRLDQDH